MANWFGYTGTGDPNLPGNYIQVDVKPSCDSGCMVCAIYLNDNTQVPSSIPSNIKVYIANAGVTLVSQPAYGAKRFVYMKSC